VECEKGFEVWQGKDPRNKMFDLGVAALTSYSIQKSKKKKTEKQIQFIDILILEQP